MNINEYISSGILEAYVLGDLTAPERAEVETNLVNFPELREELALVEQAQERLLMYTFVKPTSEIKARLFQKITANEPEVKENAAWRRLTFWRYAAAASISVAIITSYLAYNYWGKWKALSEDFRQLVAQNQQITQGYNQIHRELNSLEEDLDIMDDPRFARVLMKGTPNSPEALASVYWNQTSQALYLRIHNLKELSDENQYQLWAIVDGKPVDAGIFEGGVVGLTKMKDIPAGAAAFAVTIEPRGGRKSPTLETMQVLGDVVGG